MNPNLEALAIMQSMPGTGGAVAVAKCVLSLWNGQHRFSMSEILCPLDDRLTRVVLGMVREYSQLGETPELLQAGSWAYDNYPGLVELTRAQYDAWCQVHRKWDEAREKEAREEEEREEQRIRERNARVRNLHCSYCKKTTKHLPFDNQFECEICFTPYGTKETAGQQ